MFELKSLKTDKGAEESGIWITFDEDDAGNKAELKIRSDAYEPYKRWMVNEGTRNAQQRAAKRDKLAHVKLMKRGIAKFLWLEARGFTLDGKPFDAKSEEARLKMLKDIPDIYDFLNEETANRANFRLDEAAEDIEQVKKP